jgi:phosphatidylserine/phosphatidylglycerophosphate/cardiolipin synthase-like enzyme
LIGDKTTPCERGSGIEPLARAGAAIWIDHGVRLAHAKAMVIDRKVVLTGSMNWTAGAARNSDDINLISSETVAAAYAAHWQHRLVACGALLPARRLVSQPRCSRAQIGIAAEMKPEQDDRLEAGGDLSTAREFSVERLPPPEIVGEVGNPALETIRRLWWRSFDRVCGFFVLIRLSIHDRIFGPEPSTPADLQREAEHERLVRTFPVAAQPIEPGKHHAGYN